MVMDWDLWPLMLRAWFAAVWRHEANEAVADFNESMLKVRIALADALTPALKRTASALQEWVERMDAMGWDWT